MLRWLEAVNDSLEGKYKETYITLQSSLEEPERPEYLAYHYSLGGPLSPVDKETLLIMTDEDIIAQLNSDIPNEAYGAVAKEGFALVLQEAVKEDPEKFVLMSKYFDPTVIAPMYVHSFIQGLRDAWKSGKRFSLKLILDHINQLMRIQDDAFLDQNTDTKRPTIYLDDLKRNTLWLLSDLIRTHNHSIEKEYYGDVKQILIDSFDYLKPGKDELEKMSSLREGIITLALNDNRAIALEALINYALAFANTKYEKTSNIVHKLETDVISTFDKLLNTNEGLAVHSIFGKYFPKSD